MKFNNKEELYDHYKFLCDLKNDDKIIIPSYDEFMKISPEKLCKKFNISDEINFINEVNTMKKKVHRKKIMYLCIEKLRNRKVESLSFNYYGSVFKSEMVICSRYFEIKYKHKKYCFYPTIKYSYVDLEDTTIVLFPDNRIFNRIHLTRFEFNYNFKTLRKYKTSKILEKNGL